MASATAASAAKTAEEELREFVPFVSALDGGVPRQVVEAKMRQRGLNVSRLDEAVRVMASTAEVLEAGNGTHVTFLTLGGGDGSDGGDGQGGAPQFERARVADSQADTCTPCDQTPLQGAFRIVDSSELSA